jgi:hypothetical protein
MSLWHNIKTISRRTHDVDDDDDDDDSDDDEDDDKSVVHR